jgi:hypothetical protein
MARPHSPISAARCFGPFALGSSCALVLTLACGTEDEERSSDDNTEQATLANRAPARAVTPTRSPAPPAASVRAPSAANPPPPMAANAGGAAGNAADPEPEAEAQPARVFAACTDAAGYGSSCDSVFVTMKQMSPPQCVQLTLDNCEQYGNRSGLSVRMPMPWRLGSGTVSSNLNECELGVFYPTSSVAQRASGSVRWNETTRLPSEIALDVTLETSSVNADNAKVELLTLAAIAPTVCED